MAQRAIRGAECESVLQQVDALIKLRAHQGALDHRLAERSPLFGEVRRFGNGPPGCRAILAPLRLQEQVAPCQTLSFLRRRCGRKRTLRASSPYRSRATAIAGENIA